MWVGGWVSQGLARAPNNPPLSNSLTCTSGIRVSCGWVVWCRPLWQLPPTACRTASGAASEVPSRGGSGVSARCAGDMAARGPRLPPPPCNRRWIVHLLGPSSCKPVRLFISIFFLLVCTRPAFCLGLTLARWQNPLSRRHLREFLESGIRAFQCYDCPTAQRAGGHDT